MRTRTVVKSKNVCPWCRCRLWYPYEIHEENDNTAESVEKFYKYGLLTMIDFPEERNERNIGIFEQIDECVKCGAVVS